MDRYPQTPLTAFQASRKRCSFLSNRPFSENVFLAMFVNIYVFLVLKTPNRRRTQFRVEKILNCVLSSHLDPIGDQNDVQ